jgi:hypothetical protein
MTAVTLERDVTSVLLAHPIFKFPNLRMQIENYLTHDSLDSISHGPPRQVVNLEQQNA